jgi:rare lipoprotein A
MTSNKARRIGVRTLAAIAAAGLMHSTPGIAQIDAATVAAVDTLSDPVEAPVAVDAIEEKVIGEGEASYYGRELAGNRTASGERFNPRALTAAHRTLPLGSKLKVTNKSNGRSVIVRINDRGPFAKSRLIDISYAAAEEIAMVRAGKARVTLALIS